MASSCTCTPYFYQRLNREVIVFQFAWTAHTDGTFTSVTTDDYTFGSRTLTQLVQGKRLLYIKTIPSAVTAPTDLYDITITDGDSADMFCGLTADRSSTLTQSEFSTMSGVRYPRTVETALTLAISNNSVNSAKGTVKLYFT